MSNYNIFCMCLQSHHLQNIKDLGYTPVGLGNQDFSDEWIRDNTGENISYKNKYYGEYTFYYWFWKNMLEKNIDGNWVGFTGYRYHWGQKKDISSDNLTKQINKENFGNYILKKIPPEWNNYEVVLGEEMRVDNWKLSKILKHGKKKFFLNPAYFMKKNQNIKLHFDIFHGEGYLDKAISVLDNSEKKDFDEFVKNKNLFHRENLFFCRSNTLMNRYFQSVFSWLKNCEKLFGFELNGYSKTRIYAFLAERYISYWFRKYSKPLNWPIFFFDTNKNRVKIK